MNKPPLGVVPRKFHEEKRIQELCRALYEYSHSEARPVMTEWIDELKELVNKRIDAPKNEIKYQSCWDCGHLFEAGELFYHSDKVRCYRCHDKKHRSDA